MSNSAKPGHTYVSFVCQRCSQPLKLDLSFAKSLDAATFNELSAPLSSSTEESRGSSPVGRKPFKGRDSSQAVGQGKLDSGSSKSVSFDSSHSDRVSVKDSTDSNAEIDANLNEASVSAEASLSRTISERIELMNQALQEPDVVIPAHPTTSVSLDDPDLVRDDTLSPSNGASSLVGGVSATGSHGFTLLGDSQPSLEGMLSHKLKVSSQLFDIVSNQAEVDHPLCEECTDGLLDQLDLQLKLTEDECADYREFLNKLENEADSDDNEEMLDKEIETLMNEERSLMEQLESISLESEQLNKQIEKEKERSKILEQQEHEYWKEYNEYKRQLFEFEDNQKSVDNQLKYAQSQLDKLKKTNVFNATFHIWHSGHFGTINNFRLGRLPSQPVEWSEINAAWGQTVLLLHSLANKMKLTFKRYRLIPYGNHSYLESLTDKSKELPLYGSGGFKFFWDSKFDHAMVAFLDCLQQFKEEVEKGDTSFSLPYLMDKGKIEDPNTKTSYSIKIQFNSEEQWTKALKFMLTNLKWGLAWVSSQFTSQ